MGVLQRLAEDTSVDAGYRPRMTEEQKRTAKLLRLANAAAREVEQVDRLRRLLRQRERQARMLRREPKLQIGLAAEIAQLVAEEEAAVRAMARSLAVLDRFIVGQGLAVDADALIGTVLEFRAARRRQFGY
jgi:hypothetical protein